MKESKFYQEILEEGNVNGLRTAVLEVLATRFDIVSANTVKDQLKAVHDADDFSELLRGATKCRSIAGFRKLLAEHTKAPAAS